MLTKTQNKIMQLFTSSITKTFTSTTICQGLSMHRKNVIEALKVLVQQKFISKDHTIYRLNYKENPQELAYIEHTRSKEFLKEKRNRFLNLFVEDALKEIKDDFFVFIIFGSTVTEPKPNDTDVFVIVKTKEQAERVEKTLMNIVTTLKIDLEVHWEDSVYEMLSKRDSKNVLNRILDKHLIFYGAETFYRLLAKGR